MLPLPTARMQVRDAAGRRQHAAAVARHAARRAGRHAIALGQISLWLGLVVLSLTTIGTLVARSSSDAQRFDQARARAHARGELIRMHERAAALESRQALYDHLSAGLPQPSESTPAPALDDAAQGQPDAAR